MIRTKTIKPDIIGAVASAICAVHCLATPVLFVVQSCSTKQCCSGGPLWWSAIDYLIMGVTFLAIYHATKQASKSWMKPALFGSWMVVAVLILNEKFSIIQLSEWWKYLATAVMITLHLYNYKSCQHLD